MWTTKTHLKFEDLSSDLNSFCLIENNASLVDCVSMAFSDFILFNWRDCFTSRLCEWNLYGVAFSYFSSMWSDDDDDVLISSWKWKDLRWLHKLQQKPCMNLSGSWQSFSLLPHLKVQETHSNGTLKAEEKRYPVQWLSLVFISFILCKCWKFFPTGWTNQCLSEPKSCLRNQSRKNIQI